MIDRTHELSLTKQAEILKISRGIIYYEPRPTPAEDLVDSAHDGEVLGRRRLRLVVDDPSADL